MRKTKGIMIPFLFTKESILKGVKQETSLYAERVKNQNNDILFDELVFDEEYDTKLIELMLDAEGRIIDRYSAYMKFERLDMANIHEELDVMEHNKIEFTLIMPCEFNTTYAKTVSVKTREYIVAYITYRWLETKMREDAEVYKIRAEETLMDARAMLEKRLYRRRTGGNLF